MRSLLVGRKRVRNTTRSSSRARQRVAGGALLECGVQSCITTATVLQYRQRAAAIFVLFFSCESICDIQADSSEMFPSLVKNPASTPSPRSPLMATNKERKSRSACLGVESSFLFFFFFFCLPAGGTCGWLFAQ